MNMHLSHKASTEQSQHLLLVLIKQLIPFAIHPWYIRKQPSYKSIKSSDIV